MKTTIGIIFGGKAFDVNPALQHFDIKSKPSSNIAFFGFAEDRMFVQFRNGSSYVYEGVSSEVKTEALVVDSIGSFVSRNIVGKYPSNKLPFVGVTEAAERAIAAPVATTNLPI